MSLPVLIGQNNPLSERPEWALVPYPTNSAGWRVWRMLADVGGHSRSDYMRMFERRNVLDRREWDRDAAKRHGPPLWKEVQDRTVIILGREAHSALGLPTTDWLIPNHTEEGGVWRLVPHPSGRTRWYNDACRRQLVGMLLEEIACGNQA